MRETIEALPRAKRGELLRKMRDEEGFERVVDMLERAIYDSVSPGVCLSCEAITGSIEPDAEEGYCEACDSNRVVSACVLAGII